MAVETVDLYKRGLRNIEDAHFIRSNLIPIAFQHGKWNVVVHQTFQALELLLKGMTCLTGHKPKTTHNTKLLTSDLLRIVSLPTSNVSHFPFALFAQSTGENNGYGVWLYDENVNIVKSVAGKMTILANFPIGDLLRVDKILRLELEIKDSTVSLVLGSEKVFTKTDSTNSGPFTLKREFVRGPSMEKMRLLKQIGGKLRENRESSFYSEQSFTEPDASKAIRLFDEANEAAAYFFVNVA